MVRGERGVHVNLVKRVLAVALGVIVLGTVGLADPHSDGGGGPFKPCATCRGVTPPPPPPAPVTP